MVVDSESDPVESFVAVSARKVSDESRTPITNPDRITFGYLYRHALEICNLERGLGFTVFRWLFQPRRAAREFLFEDRTRYVKPFTALALAVTLITFVSFQLFDIDSQMATANLQLAQLPERFRPSIELALRYVVQFVHLFLVVSLPFQALLNSYLFRHAKWYFPEHMVVMTYLYTMQMLINISVLPLFLVNEVLFGVVSTIAAPCYLIWAIFQVYDTRWWYSLMAWIGYLIIGAIIPGILAALLFGMIFSTGLAN